MDPVEVVGFVTGAVCVWLAARENVWNFPVGIANNLAFLVLFANAGLYAGAGLQVVYAGLAALGWYWWARRDAGTGQGRLVVGRVPRVAWPLLGLGAAAATAVLWAVLVRTDSPAPVLDASTTATSLVAQLMLGRKWLGSWAVWVVTDVLLVVLYASQQLWLTAVLYAVFILLCLDGARRWRAALAGRTAGEPADAPQAVAA